MSKRLKRFTRRRGRYLYCSAAGKNLQGWTDNFYMQAVWEICRQTKLIGKLPKLPIPLKMSNFHLWAVSLLQAACSVYSLDGAISFQRWWQDRAKKNVRTKKLSGPKKWSGQKKLSGQKNCPDKKLSGQKIVRTKKKLSGQKNCSDKFFLSALAMPLFFYCPSGPWFLSWVIFVHIFVPYFNKGMVTYFRNALPFLRNIMGPSNHNLSHKTLNQVTKNFTKNFIF